MASIATEMIVVDTPGPTPADVRQLPYQRIDRPAFPFEDSPIRPASKLLKKRDAAPKG